MKNRNRIQLLEDLRNSIIETSLFHLLIDVKELKTPLLIFLSDSIDNLKGKRSIQNEGFNVLPELRTRFINTDFAQIFVEIQRIIGIIYELTETKGVHSNDFPLLLSTITKFQANYQEFLRTSGSSELLDLLYSAESLDNALSITLTFIEQEIRYLQKEYDLNEGEAALSISFNDTEAYKDLYIKLESLEDLYKELCPLFDVSTSQFPLRTLKIESGSLWVEIAGSAAVISFMIWLLTQSVKFFYRNYTLEGKISYIPKELETADKVLQFSKKLEESGVDISQNKEQLQKTLFIVTEKLNTLVSNQSSMEINDKKFSVGDEYQQKFLEESRQLLIGDGSNDVEKETEEKSSKNEKKEDKQNETPKRHIRL